MKTLAFHNHSPLTWIASDTVPVIRFPVTLTLSVSVQLLDEGGTFWLLAEQFDAYCHIPNGDIIYIFHTSYYFDFDFFRVSALC